MNFHTDRSHLSPESISPYSLGQFSFLCSAVAVFTFQSSGPIVTSTYKHLFNSVRGPPKITILFRRNSRPYSRYLCFCYYDNDDHDSFPLL
ncbi:hypothetical protein CDAR_24361 [Caerostris darwini]|uniref:Uncharacterized protein n=1 Tax=Caerostris darwini TaxID=1538125 RepID=A0AAV4QHF4_9ARAC|nr:hypothetical protein CDAR_24361 [Caerostris darwini]